MRKDSIKDFVRVKNLVDKYYDIQESKARELVSYIESLKDKRSISLTQTYTRALSSGYVGSKQDWEKLLESNNVFLLCNNSK